MRQTELLPAAPLRILFILASAQRGDEAAQIATLARLLDPSVYRISAVSCFGDTRVLPIQAQLADAGVPVDIAPHEMSLEDTVRYLSWIVPRHDVLVAAQDVPDVAPALDALHRAPPLIEWQAEGATASNPHSKARVTPRPDGGARAHHIPALRGPGAVNLQARRFSDAARQWQGLFDRLSRDHHRPAPPPTLFRSFWQGGFECSTHRLRSGRRLDITAQTAHDQLAEADYRLVARYGMRTVRDGLRWHLIERTPGRFDFSSFTPMVQAAERSGTQVIWDLLHFGWPDDIDIWSPAFITRFARFAAAAGRHMREVSDEVPFWCPVNEISFLSWGAGDVGYLNPFARGRGFELKVQLARAAIVAMEELLLADPRARFVHCEPGIAIHHMPGGRYTRAEAEEMNQQQFQALDLLSGRIWPQIGGRPEFVDVVGVNYYMHNQWLHGGESIDIDHPLYRPLSDLLYDAHVRYGRPVMIAETGIEAERRPAWLAYVASEVARARARGVPVEGLCLYPIVNHPGWDDDRPCPNGLFEQAHDPGGRTPYTPLAEMLSLLQRHLPGEARPGRVARA